MNPRPRLPAPKLPIQKRFEQKEAGYAQVVGKVVEARLTQFQRLTALVALGTFALDAKIVTPATDFKTLLVLNAPLIFLSFTAAVSELYANLRRKNRRSADQHPPVSPTLE